MNGDPGKLSFNGHEPHQIHLGVSQLRRTRIRFIGLYPVPRFDEAKACGIGESGSPRNAVKAVNLSFLLPKHLGNSGSTNTEKLKPARILTAA
jgi:hypothetical protein